jgi:SAM-dependent methyltransferase
MGEPADTNAAIWHSAEAVEAWVAEAQRQESSREAHRRFMALLLPFGEQDEFTFLDLGAGTGAASRAILGMYPRSTAILADFSAEMMRAGEREMPSYAGRYRYVEFDMAAAGAWPAAIPAALDAVVTSMCVHHLPDDRKQSLFGEISGQLAPGGWYLNYDPVRAGDRLVEAPGERHLRRVPPRAITPAQAGGCAPLASVRRPELSRRLARLDQGGGHHVRGLARRRQGLHCLHDPEVEILAFTRRELPLFPLHDQDPGQLLAQLRQVLAHPPQARDDIAGVVEAGVAARAQVTQRADRLGGLAGDVPHRHRAARLARALIRGSVLAPAESGELGFFRRAVGTNPFGHLSPGANRGRGHCGTLTYPPRCGRDRGARPAPRAS